ncbi:PREDICTED: protein IQ-DOMAIN 1-like isoform X2 [Lupinus angustifolius]|uniref:protein IQ-DOMAIN 1-like isoform X2 n=1 Tax=Lupinus angustifolius TaxID=3871 RepID=UPI00092F1464|nr:PREDICTED: protein IQ-DOMAIN 1-like isoform X2 [Lupinus angustifolius]
MQRFWNSNTSFFASVLCFFSILFFVLIKELHMGRKGSWFSTVKKALNGSDSRKKQKQKQKYNKSNLGCFGYHETLESGSEEARAPVAVVPSLPPRKDVVVVKPRETENEQSKQALSLVLATAVAAGAAVAAASAAAAAAEVARLNNVSRYAGKSREEVSAIKIQTAFRRYSARRILRGMRGWVRLKRLIQGQSVKRQTTTALKCMQNFSRLQSQIHARRIRMSEENQALQRQLNQKREKELEKLLAAKVAEKWDASLKSKEQIEAKMLHRQVAAMRREKALAYSLSHQQTWRNSPKSANATFMDPNDPHWGWNWLERWMASRPWEGQSIMQQHNDHASAKSASSYATMSVGEITQLYTLRDQNHHESKNYSPATNQKASHVHSHTNPPSASKAISKVKASTSQGGSWGGNVDDSRSMFRINHESNRRHSIAISSVRDDESIASSPAFPTRIPSIKVAKSKSQIPSPFNNKGTILEKGGVVSAKKRLSFSPSPSGARRLSVPTKMGIVSNKSVANATIPEDNEKVKSKVKN